MQITAVKQKIAFMKTVNLNLRMIPLYLGMLVLGLGFTACSDDDDGGDGNMNPDPTGAITVTDDAQVISQNTLVVDQVTSNTDVWLVARDSTASGTILAQKLLTQDNNSNVELELDDTALEDGDTIFLMLYVDNGFGAGDGKFEEGTDKPLTGATETVKVNTPHFTISDATVTDNTITFDNVTVSDTGWIVVYNGNPSDETSEIVGYEMVTGSQDDVVVTLNDNYTAGDPLFARLHVEDQGDEEFTFGTDPETDIPEIFGSAADKTIWEDLSPDTL